MKNPWKTLQSNEVYDNPWIKVTENKVINPGGGEGIYGVVHFKNIAIGIIPIDQDGNIWLVGQFRYPLNEYSWEIPEGGGNLNVPILDSAKRELMEETGITAENWEVILKMHLSNSVSDEVAYIFLAQNLTFGVAQPEESEDLQVKKIHIDEAYKLICEGKITDSLTVAGILQLIILRTKNKQ